MSRVLVFSIFTELSSYPHHIVVEQLHHPKKKPLHPLAMSPKPPSNPSPWEPLIDFLSVSLCLMCTF